MFGHRLSRESGRSSFVVADDGVEAPAGLIMALTGNWDNPILEFWRLDQNLQSATDKMSHLDHQRPYLIEHCKTHHY